MPDMEIPRATFFSLYFRSQSSPHLWRKPCPRLIIRVVDDNRCVLSLVPKCRTCLRGQRETDILHGAQRIALNPLNERFAFFATECDFFRPLHRTIPPMPFTSPAAGAWPSTAAVRAGSAGAREGRDSCCRCQALSLRSQTAVHARWKCQAAPPERRSQRAFPNGPSRGPGARKPLTLFPHPSCAACPGRATPRHALLRGDAANSCCWRAMLACPHEVFGGFAPEGAGLKKRLNLLSSQKAYDGERFPSLTRITMYSGRPRRLWARPAPLHHNVLVAWSLGTH